MNLHRVVLNSLFYKLLNKGIYITVPLQTFSSSPMFLFIFFELKLGHSPFDPHELSYQRDTEGETLQSFYCCCNSEKRYKERKRGRKMEDIKGKEDVVKTQAPKRLT